MSEKKNKSKIKKIIDLIFLIILLIGIYFAYNFYQENNFNKFIRSETNPYTSKFARDIEEKYSERPSYKIQSDTYNDAMFYKDVKVEKNTPYKVTCMVKTENVQAKKENSGVGAQISIGETTERSTAISGTQDWQKIEFIFNSKNRETIKLGFRLGGYLGEATGTAWFSDFVLEKGTSQTNNQWNFACFIFETTDINLNGNEIKLEVTQNDTADITSTIKRFENCCSELSDGKMKAKCDIYKVTTPITTLSYDDEFGYYVAPEDVDNQIKEKIKNNNYDHIFAIVRLGDEQHQNDIQVNDWIGLRFNGLLWYRIL